MRADHSPIRRYRGAAGLSLRQLATLSDTNYRHLHALERGLTASEAKRVAKALKVRVGVLASEVRHGR